MSKEVTLNKSIWIIRPGALGDTILTFPLLKKIEKSYPKFDLVFIGSTQYKSVVIKYFPRIEFLSFDDVNLLPLFNENFDKKDLLINQPDKIYCILLKNDLFVQNLELFSKELFFKSIKEIDSVHVSEQLYLMDNIESDFAEDANSLFVKRNFSNEKKIRNILIHPGTGSPSKLLSEVFWLDLVATIKNLNLKVILGINDNVPDWLKNKPFLRISETEELIKELLSTDFYFGLDSGVSHLAGILGVKGIALFKNTDPNYWAPLGKIKSIKANLFKINEWESGIY